MDNDPDLYYLKWKRTPIYKRLMGFPKYYRHVIAINFSIIRTEYSHG